MQTLLAFLFVLGILVFVHELGHFLVARWYGVRVLTFSLGFGPKILKFVRGGTEYCISILPLGGYVKLAGETTEAERTGAPDEFLSKSRWVRFQVYLAGPAMNFLLAWALVAGVMSTGTDVPLFESSPAVIGTVEKGSPAEAAGLRVGDRIVSVAGQDISNWEDLNLAVVPKAGQELMLVAQRDGQRINARVTPAAVSSFEFGDLGIQPIVRPQVLQVTPGNPAEKSGIKRGDIIVAIDGERNITQENVIKRIRASAARPLVFTMERHGTSMDITVVPQGPAGSALIGASISPWETRRIDPSIGQAMVLSAKENWQNTVLFAKTMKGLVTRDTPVRQLMGPVGIAQLSGTAAELGFSALFGFMAIISLNLALLNLLPIPIFDGGQIAILALEGLMRRQLSLKVKEGILMAGAALIVLLMVTVMYNDIARLLR